MRTFRSLFAVGASALLVSAAFSGPAAAQSAGVGTSLTSTKAVVAQVGDNGSLLDLTVIADEARSTTDVSVASPEAYSRLTAIKAATSFAPASLINQTLGVFEAKDTGPSAVDLGLPALPAALAPVLSGSLTGKLTAGLNSGVASAGMVAELSNVKALGGLVSVGSVSSNLGAVSGTDSATAARAATVKDINLIDGLAAQAGLPLPSGATTMAAAVAQIQAAVNNLQAAVAGAPSTVSAVTGAVDSTTNTLLGAVGITSPLSTATTVPEAVALVNDLVNQLQATLNTLLAEGLKALDNLSLLRLEGVEVGVNTKAADTVANSVASVTGRIGKVRVGTLDLGAIDLTTTTDAISAAVASVNTKLSDTLKIVSPDLANVVKLSVLDKATSITQSGGYTRSRAGITAATATVTPPANIAAIVTGLINQANTVKSSIPSVPALDGVMNQLTSALNLGSAVLRSSAKVQVASVLSASDFARAGAAAPGTPTQLPRTGGTSPLVLFAGLAGVAALIVRRFTHHPAVRTVRIDK